MSAKRSKVVVISSVSGGGKTSLIRLLLRNNQSLHSAITATSRPPRPGEIDAVDYYFFSREEFEARIARGEFLEHALVHGNYYGVPMKPVEEKLAQGISVILNIDVQGMRSVRERFKGRVVSIFLLPPDRDTWETRLRERATNTESEIRLRLEEGLREMAAAEEYDYRVVNDFLEQAAGEVSAILEEQGVLDG